MSPVEYGALVLLFSARVKIADAGGSIRSPATKAYRKDHPRAMDAALFARPEAGVATPMVDVQEMRTIADRLRTRARQIRQDARLTTCPTADLDAGLLDQAADQLEKSGDEVDRLRELISR